MYFCGCLLQARYSKCILVAAYYKRDRGVQESSASTKKDLSIIIMVNVQVLEECSGIYI